ncbi:MAG: peptidyl-prolyl cis-trans isomerase [Krumholzibacteria bacterium]|nr:peptidyl-prolyl cis-trans isomerase [Candidatus Krumholzibacteria bacterium]
MPTYRRTRVAAAVSAALLVLPALAAAGPVALAVVNGDTLTTTELTMELGVMLANAPTDLRLEAPAPDRVLRRLIQNQLVVQEGYRMGLDQRFSVRNPKAEALRNRFVRALLDSVAALVPRGELDQAAWVGLRQLRVESYLDELRRNHGVQVDTLLLASLDYASADAGVLAALRDSDQVIARLDGSSISVADLTREIRFVAFHGLEGKPDAAERRDKIFWDTLHERLLYREARRLGLDRRPDMARYAASVERGLMLEEATSVLVRFEFAPDDQAVRAFYAANLAAVTPPVRIRMESVKLTNEQAARSLRDKALQGAKLSWLARNMPDVVDGPPPFPTDFFLPQQVGLDAAAVEVGLIPEPYGVPGAWVVARVAEIEQVVPRPLEQCRNEILTMMQARATQEHMADVLARLEAASTVEILPGAVDEVAKVTADVVATRERSLEKAEPAPATQPAP